MNYIKQDYIFLTYIIDHYAAIISTHAAGNYGGGMNAGFEFATTVTGVDGYLLGIEGIVAIIYYETYETKMPSITTAVTNIEASRIYEIYDVMQVERPTLTIV